MLSAKEQYQKTLAFRDSLTKAELTKVALLIEQASSEGKTYALFMGNLQPETKKELENKGYKLNYRMTSGKDSWEIIWHLG